MKNTKLGSKTVTMQLRNARFDIQNYVRDNEPWTGMEFSDGQLNRMAIEALESYEADDCRAECWNYALQSAIEEENARRLMTPKDGPEGPCARCMSIEEALEAEAQRGVKL